jgi:hypothetical protein
MSESGTNVPIDKANICKSEIQATSSFLDNSENAVMTESVVNRENPTSGKKHQKFPRKLAH